MHDDLSPRRTRRWFRTLTSRLTLILFGLLLLATVMQALVASIVWRDFVARALQDTKYDLAEKLAVELRPAIAAGDVEAVRERMRQLAVLTDDVDVFLLDENGVTLHPPGQRIDTGPIKRFLSSPRPPLPILNRNPRDTLSDPGPFSAAPVTLPHGPGYLYVMLQSSSSGPLSETLYEDWAYRFAFVSACISWFVVLVVGAIVVRFVTRPLRELESALAGFRAGRYDERVPYKRDDEIGSLAETFNTMASTIERTIGELTRVEGARRELIAHISHDLRSPVATARAALELLSTDRPSLTPELRARHLRNAERSLDALSGLVVNLFDLSKLEIASGLRCPEAFDFSERISDVVAELQPVATAANVSLLVQAPEKRIRAVGEARLIERAVRNLVENAIRYSPEGGRVSVTIEAVTGGGRVEVTDEGPGIPEADLEKLGQPLFRVMETAQQFEGSGLGLAIVKRILALHGTSLSVSSSVGVGSTFGFVLAGDAALRQGQPGTPLQSTVTH